MNISVGAFLRYVLVFGALGLSLLLLVGAVYWLATRPLGADSVTGAWKVDLTEVPESSDQNLPPGVDTSVPAWLSGATLELTSESCSLLLPDGAPLVVPCTYTGITSDRILIQVDRDKAKELSWKLPTTLAIFLDSSNGDRVIFKAAYWSVFLNRVP